MKKLILLIIPFLIWCGIRSVSAIIFDIDCGNRMERAANANTVELATTEMKTVVEYLEKNSITNGYTSVLYKTPDEDIGFFYQNMKSSYEELLTVDKNATKLEKSNILMKLRESLMHHGDSGGHITIPSGISVYPHNTILFIFGWLSTFVMVYAGIKFCYKYGMFD